MTNKILFDMQQTCGFEYEKLLWTELTPADRLLADKAVEALAGSHSPYSGYAVGASVLLGNGEIILGANQENASYPCGTCAERTALDYARSANPADPVLAMAIVARRHGSDSPEDFVSPCGLCRQAIVEVERMQNRPIRLLLVGRGEVWLIPSAGSLLPFAF